MSRRRRPLAALGVIALLAAGASLANAGQASLGAGSALMSERGMPYALFDKLPVSRIGIGASTIEVAFAPGDLDLSRARLLDWVAACARAVAHYYGGFPVPRLRLLIVPVEGEGVRHGTSYGYGGAAIKVSVGTHTDAGDLKQDWVLTHEMVHLAFPSVARQHHWIEEGIATYVEPLARTQTAELSPARVWGDLVEGLPKGLPQPGDRGLDRTPTWGRTYWGGALFCLLADIDIRRRTDNRFGLQDALRAIVGAGGSIEVDWPLRRALEIGDAATGTSVLTELYDRMRETPVATDLNALWQKLGVSRQGQQVTFDDAAPLAAVRRAITRGSTGYRERREATPRPPRPRAGEGRGEGTGLGARMFIRGGGEPRHDRLANRAPARKSDW